MVTVFRMCMIVYPAGFVVQHMRRNNEHNGKGKENILVTMPDLLGDKKGETCRKHKNWYQAMMMKAVAVPQRIASYAKCKDDHEIFERHIVDQVNPEYGQRP